MPREEFMKVRVLIAEDEALCREHLRKLLDAEPHVEVVGECTNGTSALETIQQIRPDIVFLDLRMPGLDGFAVVKRLDAAHLPVFIIVTADDRSAVEAFDVQAADYLLKPFDRSRFKTALQRGRERVRYNSIIKRDAEKPTVESSAESSELERLTIHSGGRIIVIQTREIDWISSSGNYVEIHFRNAKYLLRTSLNALKSVLPKDFVQISRSALVNLNHIEEIRPRKHGDYTVILRDSTTLNGSRNFRDGAPGLARRSRAGRLTRISDAE